VSCQRKGQVVELRWKVSNDGIGEAALHTNEPDPYHPRCPIPASPSAFETVTANADETQPAQVVEQQQASPELPKDDPEQVTAAPETPAPSEPANVTESRASEALKSWVQFPAGTWRSGGTYNLYCVPGWLIELRWRDRDGR
jgi:hypothetical protein